MRIYYPRVPFRVVIRGRTYYKLGPAQRDALLSLKKFKRGEEPPKGFITAAGFIRKHIYNDMVPFGWVGLKIVGEGVVDYTITKLGLEVLENQLPAKYEKVEKLAKAEKPASLLDKQRDRAAARAAARKGAQEKNRKAA